MTEAMVWYQKSAQQEYFFAQGALARAYLLGIGTPVDYQKALYWYEKAVHHPSVQKPERLNSVERMQLAVCQTNFAAMYARGMGVEIDQAKATHWYLKAAENGDEDAPGKIEMLEERKAQIASGSMTDEEIGYVIEKINNF